MLATEATVTAGRYAALVRTLDAGVDVFQVACPALVPLIESDDPYGASTVEAVREYAAPLQAAGVDTVILGCTHYPLIRPILQRVFGRGVTLVFSAEETAREVAETLARKGIENDPARTAPTVSSRPATGSLSARWARASCNCRSTASSTSRSPSCRQRRDAVMPPGGGAGEPAGSPDRARRRAAPAAARRGPAGETGFPPRERAEGE